MSGNSIVKAAELLASSRRAVAFTGAGISTESGIPDFRGPGGIWSKYQPVMFQDFLASEEARKQYWRMKKEGYPGMKEARPNEGHKVLARLEAREKITAVITQNIDGLHQDAGSRRVLELHGTNRHCLCLNCAARYASEDIQQRLESGVEVPLCDRCGGLLKSATISFGQPLPIEVLSEAYDLCSNTDLILAIGSSLVVEPAASLPRRAAGKGAQLVIINRTETPLDGDASAVIRAGIGEMLTTLEKLLY